MLFEGFLARLSCLDVLCIVDNPNAFVVHCGSLWLIVDTLWLIVDTLWLTLIDFMKLCR